MRMLLWGYYKNDIGVLDFRKRPNRMNGSMLINARPSFSHPVHSPHKDQWCIGQAGQVGQSHRYRTGGGRGNDTNFGGVFDPLLEVSGAFSYHETRYTILHLCNMILLLSYLHQIAGKDVHVEHQQTRGLTVRLGCLCIQRICVLLIIFMFFCEELLLV